MDIETFRDYCLSLPAVEENAPWRAQKYRMLITYTVGEKWFVIENIDEKYINVKASPETVESIRDKYRGAFPAWHMNKKHWVGIRLDSDIPDNIIRAIVREGYDLVVSNLTTKKRYELNLDY